MNKNLTVTTLQGSEVSKLNSESLIWAKLKANSELKKTIKNKTTSSKAIKPIPKGLKLTEICVNLNKFAEIQRAKKEGFKTIEFIDSYGFMLPNVNLEIKGKTVNEILRETLTYLVRNLKEKQFRTKFNKELKNFIENDKAAICEAENINVSIDNDILYKRLCKSSFDEMGFPLHTKLILQLTYNNNIVRYLLDAKALSDVRTKVLTTVNLGLRVLDEE